MNDWTTSYGGRIGGNQYEDDFWSRLIQEYAPRDQPFQASIQQAQNGGIQMPSETPWNQATLSQTTDRLSAEDREREDRKQMWGRGLAGLGSMVDNFIPLVADQDPTYFNMHQNVVDFRPYQNPGLAGLQSLLQSGAGLGLRGRF